MTILRNTKHPTDDIHHGMRALQGINDLVITASNCGVDTSNREAVRQLARVMGDQLGNLPPLPGIFPTMSPRSFANATAGGCGALPRVPLILW